MVRVEPITAENWEAVIALDVHPEQRPFVPSVTLALAKAYVCPGGREYEPYGIFAAEGVVGFYMLMYNEREPQVCYIADFMVDARYQRQGYGHRAMALYLEDVRRRFPTCRGVFLTVHPENKAAARFYESLGFSKTGLVVDGEDAMALPL